MRIDARLQLKQTQKLIMTQMLQQAIKLLPLSRLELVQTIRQELMENPLLDEILLEEDDEIASTDKEEPASESDEQEPASESDEKEQSEPEGEIDWDLYMQDMMEMGLTSTANHQEFPSHEATLSRQMSLADYLLWQLAIAASDEATKEIGTYIVGNIDEEGYLTTSVEEIGSRFDVSLERVEEVLRLIHTLDPTGVGSRDLKECLLLQIRQGELNGTLVERLVDRHLENIEERFFPRIARDLGVSVEEIVRAVQLIRELDPKPGLKHSPEPPGYIIPDVIVIKLGDEYQVFLGIPRLRVNAYYYNMLRRQDSLQVDAKKFVEDKLRSAVWLMKSIEQRRQTLFKVGTSIVRFQREFLDNGTKCLKPLILKDVAEDIGMHESTVSRVTTNKYMHTPQGIFELKYFFHSGLDSLEGETMSSVLVKDMIKKLVESEDSRAPLTDQQIVEELQKRNVQIARRTVTKYRKELKIMQSSRRRRIYTI
jgi:RNA polymerase sigma-54 factor